VSMSTEISGSSDTKCPNTRRSEACGTSGRAGTVISAQKGDANNVTGMLAGRSQSIR
jgi:hypothetical protein